MTTFQLRRATAAQWTSANPTLAAGEPGLESDTGRLKIGDGSTAWASLPTIDQGLLNRLRTTYGQMTAQPTGGIVPSANRMYGVRFVPDRNMIVKSIGFAVGSGATSNDSCDVGIFDTAGTKIVSSGATAGKMNSSNTPQAVTIADTPVLAGVEYFLALAYGAVGGTAATLAMAVMGVGCAANLLAQTLNATPQAQSLGFFKDAAYPLANVTISGAAFTANLPVLVART